eukprot:5374470-Amphidinium_carterae.1
MGFGRRGLGAYRGSWPLRSRHVAFEGVTGYVSFDDNADRIGDFELWNVLQEGGVAGGCPELSSPTHQKLVPT